MYLSSNMKFAYSIVNWMSFGLNKQIDLFWGNSSRMVKTEAVSADISKILPIMQLSNVCHLTLPAINSTPPLCKTGFLLY